MGGVASLTVVSIATADAAMSASLATTPAGAIVATTDSSTSFASLATGVPAGVVVATAIASPATCLAGLATVAAPVAVFTVTAASGPAAASAVLNPPPTASSLTRIMSEIKTLIVDGGFYEPAQVFVSIDPDPWPTLSGPFAVVRPGKHTLIEGQWLGGGAYLAGYVGTIVVRVADQRVADEVGRDDVALLALDSGLIDRGQSLVEYLTGDDSATAILSTGLVQRDLVPRRIERPTYRRSGTSREDRRWRGVDLAFEVQWTHIYKNRMN